jgi:hypothetical protein
MDRLSIVLFLFFFLFFFKCHLSFNHFIFSLLSIIPNLKTFSPLNLFPCYCGLRFWLRHGTGVTAHINLSHAYSSHFISAPTFTVKLFIMFDRAALYFFFLGTCILTRIPVIITFSVVESCSAG